MARFARLLREGHTLDCYWYNKLGCSQHKATSYIRDGDGLNYDPDDLEDWQWPKTCDICQESVPLETAVRKISPARVYNTPSGSLEPGYFYWITWLPEDYFWSNHKGPHLAVVAPNGFRWVIDGQATNCSMARNLYHRCWAWEGDPVAGTVTVLNDDRTCRPVGGPAPVTLGSWTGILKNGIFIPMETYELSGVSSTY